jgi:hypothetical protein
MRHTWQHGVDLTHLELALVEVNGTGRARRLAEIEEHNLSNSVTLIRGGGEARASWKRTVVGFAESSGKSALLGRPYLGGL